MMSLSAAEAFDAYEDARPLLPTATVGKPAARRIETLSEITDAFDLFLLDAFGVLNIGDSAIEGTPDRVRELRAAGKRVIVVSNAASVPREALQRKYARLGYEFNVQDIVTSRMAAIAAVRKEPERIWGVMGRSGSPMDDFGHLHWHLLCDDPKVYDRVDGFLLVGSGEWTEQRQDLLESSLASSPRPVLVANPDIVAPRETGFSTEPGYFAHRLAAKTGLVPGFFGKPFASVYDLALEALGISDRSRVVMVGDSLHTDVLGAQTAGIASVLISDYGFFAGQDVHEAIAQSGIVPDFIANRP